MPELPEVETVRRGLVQWLTGRTIRRVRFVEADPHSPKYADLTQARGQRITAVTRRGKFLLLPLSGGDELVVHLGMTGSLSARPVQARHIRVVLELGGPGRRQLCFEDPRRFGRMLVVARGEYGCLPTLQHMGPEPLDDGFTAARLFRALQASSAKIKAHLLSQRPVAGLGNIYVDEALWAARIHPQSAAHTISRRKVRGLHGAIIDVLQASITAGGTTISDFRAPSGDAGSFRRSLSVYGRTGEACPNCGSSIRKLVVAGRGTHICPRCQRHRSQTKAQRS